MLLSRSGFVRLSVVKPLALGSAQQRIGALRVIEAERGPVIALEGGFGEIAMQVSLADVMELPVNGPLEQSEERLDRVGMMEAAGPNILVSRMVDGAVSRELAA